MDFAALPPEVNSARMYAGPGAAPMMAAAASWNALSAELTDIASSCESVISALAGDEWRGPASASMAAAATPYVAWINATATALEQAATQATASAAAFQTAFAMTVPPPLIVANRSQLALLVATNFLGQNAAAIAATEARYGAMWAQDAAAMYTYAASSASAGVLPPLASPASTTNPAGLAGQAAAVSQSVASSTGAQAGLSQLITGLPGAVQGLASPLSSPAGFLSDLLNSGGTGAWNGIEQVANAAGNIASWNMFAGIAAGVGLAQASGAAIGGIEAGTGTALVDAVVPAAPATGAAGGGKPVLVSVGQAAPVGGLSVPAGWSAAVPAPTAASAGSGWVAAAEDGVALEAVPAGAPVSAASGRGSFGYGTPRYGVRPTVMSRPVAAG